MVAIAGVAFAACAWLTLQAGGTSKHLTLIVIGVGLGLALYHAAFGFTSAYREAIVARELSGVSAQIVMLIVAMLLFAPLLSAGKVFGHGVGGAYAPVSVSMTFGAFLFGVGMQLGGGCASGTLYTVGAGSVRMIATLVMFCAGCLLATLHWSWWTSLPSAGAISLGRELGWWPAVAVQVVALLTVYGLLRAVGARNTRSLWWNGTFSYERLLRGPWPLLLSALLLALLNWAVMLVAGHPWSVTSGLTLWAGKVASVSGWESTAVIYWSGSGRQAALARSVFLDHTSLTNFGIVMGAFAGAGLAGRYAPTARIAKGSWLAAIIGGLMLGYGARLAYGCNIGAFFSGVSSTSLHGWVWIVAALAGNVVGVKLRPRFGLPN
ncbi:MAG: YeeE/YedE family protein [Gammaproteobacteria bacterium]